jgi:hypothetical protein
MLFLGDRALFKASEKGLKAAIFLARRARNISDSASVFRYLTLGDIQKKKRKF